MNTTLFEMDQKSSRYARRQLANIRRILLGMLVSVAWCWVIGCGAAPGPDRVGLHGAVLCENQPLKAGRITFTPISDAKGPVAVATISQGFYEFHSTNGPVVGRNNVQIESMPDPGFALDEEAANVRVIEGGKKAVLPRERIPADFNKRSNIIVTISRDGERKWNFTIEVPDEESRGEAAEKTGLLSSKS